tara:strand:+ start:496 stop:1221 length:726 start_codon:yes stop_codon:yes gene_type:complete
MSTKTITEWKKFLIKESGFNRIIDILSGGVPSVDSVAFLTGGNPMGERMPAKVNKSLNRELAEWLRERGLGFIRIRGSFGGPEKSFIVNNITKEETIAAGNKFDQEAVIWGEKNFDEDGDPLGFTFYYIEGDKIVQTRDITLSDESVQSREDFYSQERQSAGRKFVIPFFDEDYEIVISKESNDYIDIPALSEEQFRTNHHLIDEIRSRAKKSLEENRTPKSRWHHRQILKMRLRELKNNL